MSYIYAEKLIELAIRVGVDDVQKDPTLIDLMFFTDKQLDQGRDITPPGATESVFEKTLMDKFQQKISALPRTKADVTGEIFKNAIPRIPDIKEYLSTANIRIIHGFPREAQDIPCICITLGNEDESQYLGTQKGELISDDNTKRYKIIGSDWDGQYNITIMTPNYDETIVWYYLLKYSLTVYRATLEAYGMRQQKLSFGDIEPAPEYIQAGLFVYQRSCTLVCVKEEDIPIVEEGFTGLEMGINTVHGPINYQDSGQLIPCPEECDPEEDEIC